MAPFRRVVGKESCGFYVGVSCRDIFGTRRWWRRDMVRQSYPECVRRVIVRDAPGDMGIFFGSGFFWWSFLGIASRSVRIILPGDQIVNAARTAGGVCTGYHSSW
jgi:hypothetical protein